MPDHQAPVPAQPQTGESLLVGELRRTLGRLEAGLALISDGLAICDHRGHVLWCNAGLERMISRSKMEVLGLPLDAVLPPTIDQLPCLTQRELEQACLDYGSKTVILNRQPLRVFEVEWTPILTEKPNPVVFCVRDMSSWVSNQDLRRQVQALEENRKEVEQTNQDLQMRQLALAAQVVECPVTGLPNRRGLEDRLTQALKRLQRRSGLVAVLFCDLNGFKDVNDIYGHAAGDDLLIELSRRLRQSLRPEDTLARLGGDEFVVITEDIHTVDAVIELAQRLQARLSAAWSVQGDVLHPSMSVGIASTNSATATMEQLLREADLAMYKAKERRGQAIAVYDASIDQEIRRSVVIRRQLHQSLSADLLSLVYQPIVNLRSGALEGMEALVRLSGLEDEEISPAEFIPVAERSDLILPLGTWVLRQALKAIKACRTSGLNATMSVNISPRQLGRAGLAHHLLGEVAALEVDPHWLAIEVTETTLLDQSQAVQEELGLLRQAGIRIYLDDFGTGYSSMAWLTRLPIDVIKIDRDFIAGMLHDPNKKTLVETIVQLAHSLKLTVVAEGVETESQRQALLELGCEQGQGFLFSRPRPLQQLLDQHTTTTQALNMPEPT